MSSANQVKPPVEVGAVENVEGFQNEECSVGGEGEEDGVEDAVEVGDGDGDEDEDEDEAEDEDEDVGEEEVEDGTGTM